MPAHSEVFDKPNGEYNQAQVARYQNSYRLESNNVFKVAPVDELVEAVLNENLENFSYDTAESVKICIESAEEIERKIRALKFDRYKIIVIVTIVEKASQAVDCTLGFLWDCQKDNYTKYTFEYPSFYVCCCVFGIYYE